MHFEDTGNRNPARRCSPSFYLGKDSWKRLEKAEEELVLTVYPENVNSSKSPVMSFLLLAHYLQPYLLSLKVH